MARKTRKEYWLVDMLNRNKRMNYERIAEQYILDFGEPLPKGSFRKLMDGLAQDLGIHMECERAGGYNYYIVNDTLTSHNELLNMQIGSISLANIVRDVLPDSRLIDVDAVPTADERLYTICRALKEQKRIVTHYQPTDKEGYALELCPYGVKMHLCKWYVVGKSLRQEHQDCPVRTFALERMDDVQLSKKRCNIPKAFSVEKYFEGCVGVLTMGEPEPVILKVTGTWQRAHFRKLPFHSSQQLIGSGDDYDMYSYRLRPNQELMQAIISHGHHCEVKHPDSLRRQVAEEVRRMAEVYSRETDNSPQTFVLPKGMTLTNHAEHCTFVETQNINQ